MSHPLRVGVYRTRRSGPWRRVFTPGVLAGAEIEGARTHSNRRVVLRNRASRALQRRLQVGDYRFTPFFDIHSDAPVATPQVLSVDDRARLMQMLQA